MHYLGISCGFHDAAVSVVNSKGEILFAGHSERYSKNKHDAELCPEIMADAFNYIGDQPYQLHYYERPFAKAVRQVRAGQKVGPLLARNVIGKEIYDSMKSPRIYTHCHHLSHAAAGFQTSPFSDATIIVIDAIGELDTVSIWDAYYDYKGNAVYRKLWSKKYPNSLGMFYSAVTQRVGLKPMDEEYILMGMAAYGQPKHTDKMIMDLLHDKFSLDFTHNLHAGLDDEFLKDADNEDMAASAQKFIEILLSVVLYKAKVLGTSNNLVYGGGVALNCLANRQIGAYYRNIWIMPNPGDAGNSLGAAALGYKKKLNWRNAFLGHEISGYYPVVPAFLELNKNKIVGVASGKAEFGPRALGNRSLLADPRGPDIKDKVNEIKRRQKFRPFAPVILEELVHQYFEMPHGWQNSRYMQVVARCKYPDKFPAIIHADGTSRVQTVPKDDSGIRKLLNLWYVDKKCPMLLNTSLNIRGEPMVNDRSDAKRFQEKYGIKVV